MCFFFLFFLRLIVKVPTKSLPFIQIKPSKHEIRLFSIEFITLFYVTTVFMNSTNKEVNISENTNIQVQN